MPKHLVILAGLFSAITLSGCARHGANSDATRGAAPAIAAPAPQVSAPSAPPAALPLSVEQPSPRRTNSFVVRGTGQFFREPGTPKVDASETATGDIALHFVNASIADVAKAVLGDVLKLNYVVAPSVQGTVTLDSSYPLKREDVLPALQTAFRLAGAAVVEVQGVWRVVPLADAPRQGEPLTDRAAERAQLPGFAVQIVPLRYVSAEEMQRLLEPVVPQGSILRVDKARNLLVLGGSAQDLAAMREQVATFDVDWLAGMSFALVPLKLADAKSVADELAEIAGRDGGPMGGLVRVMPIERMNAVLVISPQPGYLDQLIAWANRLDRANEKADLQLHVYPVQYGRATDLATTLRKVFSGGGSAQENAGTIVTTGQQGVLVRPPGGVLAGPPAGLMAAPLVPSAPGYSAPSPAAPSAAGGLAGPDNGNHGGGVAGPQITADETNNALLILATPAEYDLVETAMKKLDVPPLQVLIEASIAEVTLTDNLQYGVQYFLQSGKFAVLRTSSTAIPPSIPVPGFDFLFSSGVNSKVILDLLQSVTQVNVISAPQMMVLNNQTATLQVGDQVPIATQSAVSVITSGAPVVNTIEYRDTGVILRITPRVNQGGMVLLDIGQEVSDVSQTTTSSLNSPTISQRRFASSVAVRDGETTALGGLIRDSRTESRSGIPVLRDIPVVGTLFGDTTRGTSRTELLVLITPHVVRTDQDARTITDEFRRRMRAVVPLENLTR